MTSDADNEASCLERLHREAITCLETFPNKIIELNDLVNQYTPDSIKNNKHNENVAGRKTKCQSTLASPRNWDLNSVSDYVSSYYSLSMGDRGKPRHGVCKRRYYRTRGLTGPSTRRRPGPLGQLLALLVSGLATCTKKIVIAPSQYIIDNIIATFFQRRELKHAQCGPSPNWDSSLSTYVTAAKKDTTIIGNLIDIMRPAAVKLIADTTTLKRWLQAVALNNVASSSLTELMNATRRIETIDCWAYELFFHLKYLQVNRAPRTTDKVILYANCSCYVPVVASVITEAEAKPPDVIHVNLWHRLVQLRDNYIILYEDKVRDLDSEKPSERLD